MALPIFWRLYRGLLRYSGPPQGGDRNMASATRRGATWKKSPTMNSIFSRTPYMRALLRAFSILLLSISTAITLSQVLANWMALPPTPQKASTMIPQDMTSAMWWAIFSGVTEYQASSSIKIPSSYRENRRYLWTQYLLIP